MPIPIRSRAVANLSLTRQTGHAEGGGAVSLRFSERVRRDMVVRDIRNRFPQTREVFDRLGVRVACWDCSLAEIAHRSGTSLEELLGALNAVTAKALKEEQERSEAP